MGKDKEYINFVLTGDKNFIIPLTVTMTSILINLNKKRIARFFMFTTDFDENALKKLELIKNKYPCEIINVPMEEYYHYFENIDPSTARLDYLSIAAWYRLLMVKILPSDVKKCFYIDGDIVVDCDLSKTYDEIDENHLLSAIVEIQAMQHRKNILKKHYKMVEFKKFAKNPQKYPYVNSGFLLFNIEKCKEESIFEQFIAFMKKYPILDFPDQDIINAVIVQKYINRVNFLDPSYNVFCSMDHNKKYDKAYYPTNLIKNAFKHPNVYHYGGADKPWINRKTKYYYKIWWKYCKKSPYKCLKQPKKEPSTLIKKVKRICKIIYYI